MVVLNLFFNILQNSQIACCVYQEAVPILNHLKHIKWACSKQSFTLKMA